MNLEARQRLLCSKWGVVAAPQVVPDEHDSSWFDDFHRLVRERHLFEYGRHDVWLYSDPYDAKAVFFVALDADGTPQYINQVYSVTVSGVDLLQGYDVWMHASVAFATTADRAKLKGLATKIFWDYLASNKNAAVTDSQQTQAGRAFWKKLLTPQAKYLAVTVDDSYSTTSMRATHSSDRWETPNHLGYEVSKQWTSSDAGKYLRVILTRD